MLLRIMTHLFLSKMCANVFLLWCFTASISCQLRRANNFFLYKVTPFLRFFLIKKEGRWKFSLLYLYRFLILRSGELCTKKFSISLLLQYTIRPTWPCSFLQRRAVVASSAAPSSECSRSRSGPSGWSGGGRRRRRRRCGGCGAGGGGGGCRGRRPRTGGGGDGTWV